MCRRTLAMKTNRKLKSNPIIIGLLTFLIGLAVFRERLKSEYGFDKIPLRQDFQKIGNGTDKLYVYSAYFYSSSTNITDGSVTILAGLRTHNQKPLFCKFYSEDGQESLTVEATLRPLSTDNTGPGAEKPYVPNYIICNVSGNHPTFVSVFESGLIKRKEPRTNLLRIKYRNSFEKKYNFVLCVQPVYSYEKPLRFAEFIEFYKMMGVEKFTFYSHSIGPETYCLMESYGDLVEILPWTCPYVAEEEIRYYGQFIGENECLHRYKSVSNYLVIVDLDEFIMPSPSVGNNYVEMMESLNQFASKNQSLEEVSGYIFRNGFFFPETDSVDSKLLAKVSLLPIQSQNSQFQAGIIFNKLHILKKTLRAKSLQQHGARSKYIVVPDKVIEVAAHVIVESIGKSRPVFIPFHPNLAYSHHYRDCKMRIGRGLYFNWCNGKDKIIESSGRRFAEDISLKIATHLHSKARHCNISINVYQESHKS